jgi:hypothetical protein
MDAISVDALTALILQAAAGEAGKNTWAGLLALARRAFKRSQAAQGALEQAASGDQQAATQAAEHLVAQSRLDPAVGEALRAWMTHALAQVGQVTNVVSGEARVRGSVVQARDIQGPVTFH